MDFKLRPWRVDDLDDLVFYANNINISKFLTDKFPHPYTREDGKKFINYVTQNDPPNVMAIIINGKASGGIGIHPREDIEKINAELGYWLAEDYWGNGIITQAIKQIIDYGFQYFDITRIFARPFGSNKASQRVLEKCGFILEAKFENTFIKNGVFEDELVYAVRNNDSES